MGRTDPRRPPGFRIQPPVQLHRAPLLRRLPPQPSRVGRPLPAAYPPARRRVADPVRADRSARPRRRRRQDGHHGHGRPGDETAGDGQQAGLRRPQPHARAVQPRVSAALSPSEDPRSRPGRHKPTPAKGVRRPLRRRGMGRSDHDPCRLRTHPRLRRHRARVPRVADCRAESLHRRKQLGRQRPHGQESGRSGGPGGGTPQGTARRLAPRRGRHLLRSHRNRLRVSGRGPGLQEPGPHLAHHRHPDGRLQTSRGHGNEGRLAPKKERPAGGHLRHRDADRQQRRRDVRDAALPRPNRAGGRRDRALRRVGRQLRPDRHLPRAGSRFIQLSHDHPVRPLRQRPRPVAHVQSVRRRANR